LSQPRDEHCAIDRGLRLRVLSALGSYVYIYGMYSVYVCINCQRHLRDNYDDRSRPSCVALWFPPLPPLFVVPPVSALRVRIFHVGGPIACPHRGTGERGPDASVRWAARVCERVARPRNPEEPRRERGCLLHD